MPVSRVEASATQRGHVVRDRLLIARVFTADATPNHVRLVFSDRLTKGVYGAEVPVEPELPIARMTVEFLDKGPPNVAGGVVLSGATSFLAAAWNICRCPVVSFA